MHQISVSFTWSLSDLAHWFVLVRRRSVLIRGYRQFDVAFYHFLRLICENLGLRGKILQLCSVNLWIFFRSSTYLLSADTQCLSSPPSSFELKQLAQAAPIRKPQGSAHYWFLIKSRLWAVLDFNSFADIQTALFSSAIKPSEKWGVKTQSLHNDSLLNGLKPFRKGEQNANASPPKTRTPKQIPALIHCSRLTQVLIANTVKG